MTLPDSQLKQILFAAYDAIAPAYERLTAPLYRPIAKRLLQRIDLRPGWRVLDAGTGTGLIALLGAPRVGKEGRIVGIDASEKMLDIARQKAAQFGFSQCEFRVGDIQSLDFPAAHFHAALSQFALHHTDPARSLAEFHRVLMPGGMLVVHEWADTPNVPNRAFRDALTKRRAAEPSDALRWLRAQSERANEFRRAIATPEGMELLAQAARFSEIETRKESFPFRIADVEAFIALASASPLVYAEIAELAEDVREEFLRDARQALRAFESPRGLEWTYEIVALVARK
jgi:ubiquinone/menaquinone biosynthesis C-methylase UbiE